MLRKSSSFVHQVLFEVNEQAVTTMDFKNFLGLQKSLKSEVKQWPLQNDLNEFLMLEFCYLEALKLDLKPEAKVVNQYAKLFSKRNQAEVYRYLVALEYLKLKEKQFSSVDRYKSWFDFLKKKYNFVIKTDEIKSQFE